MLNDEIMRAVLVYNKKLGFLDDLNPEKCDLQKYIALYPNATDEELMGPLYFIAAIPPELEGVLSSEEKCYINDFLTRERIKNARAHHARFQKECLADMMKLSYQYKDLEEYIETNLKPRIEAANKRVEELDNYQKSLPHGFATKKEGKEWYNAIVKARHERTELESELIYHEAELDRLRTCAITTRDMGTGEWQRAREAERRASYEELKNHSNGTTQQPEIIGVGNSAAAAPAVENPSAKANNYDSLYKSETNASDRTVAPETAAIYASSETVSAKKTPVALIVTLAIFGSLFMQFMMRFLFR